MNARNREENEKKKQQKKKPAVMNSEKTYGEKIVNVADKAVVASVQILFHLTSLVKETQALCV